MQMPLLPTSCWPEHHLSPLGLLTGLEAGKPKIKALADWVCGDSPLPGSQSAHPAVSSHQGRVEEFCGLFFNKGPKFIHKDSTFMTQLPCCSHCSLNSGWARCKLRGWKETQGAVGTADSFILSSAAIAADTLYSVHLWGPNRHSYDTAAMSPLFR